MVAGDVRRVVSLHCGVEGIVTSRRRRSVTGDKVTGTAGSCVKAASRAGSVRRGSLWDERAEFTDPAGER
jgi:hypothetical protein